MKKLFCVALFLIDLSSGPVHASTLIGTNVTLIYSIGPNVVLGPVTTTSTDTFLVTGGVNITCPGGAFNACGILTSPTQTITVGANTLTWNYNSTQPSQFLVANPNKFDFENL